MENTQTWHMTCVTSAESHSLVIVQISSMTWSKLWDESQYSGVAFSAFLI